MRRILLLLTALLAVLSSTLVGAPGAQAAGANYVALGDSYASGAGLTPYSNSGCYRSATQAYPTLLAGTTWTLSFLACTGVTTDSMVATQVTGAPDTNVKAVTVTIGGNDIGFAKILTDCVVTSVTPGGCTQATRDATQAALSSLQAKVEAALGAVKNKYPSATVHVTGYPVMFGSVFKNDKCVVGSSIVGSLWITKSDAGWLNTVATDLNAKISSAAKAKGATYDDVAALFRTHGRCDSSTAWVNGVVMKSFFSLTASERSFHPTATGQKSGYAAAINAAGFSRLGSVPAA